MRKARFWIFVTGIVVMLALGGVLFAGLAGFGGGTAHAQGAATATLTPTGGIRTVVTGTTTPVTTPRTGTVTPLTGTTTPVSTPRTGTGTPLTGTVSPSTALTPSPSPTRRLPITGTVPANLARTITVVGEGRVRNQPDTAQTTIGVDVVTGTVRAATSQVSTTMASVLDALRRQGIPERDIQTSGYNIFVERNPAPNASGTGQEIVRYHVNNNVLVTIRDLTKVGSVLDAAINAGANNVYGVSFSVADQKAPEQRAYAEAMDDAVRRADYLASLAGLQLGPVVSIDEIIGQNQILLRQAAAQGGMGGGGAGPISPGELEVMRQIEVVFAVR